MNFAASSSVRTFDQAFFSDGVRKYASADLLQSLYFDSCASAIAANASPAAAKSAFFTVPPRMNPGF